jgi:hypothetical protein
MFPARPSGQETSMLEVRRTDLSGRGGAAPAERLGGGPSAAPSVIAIFGLTLRLTQTAML